MFGHSGSESGPFGHRRRGRFGEGFGNFGDILRTGRMMGDRDLRLIALTLIAEEPRTGFEIIDAIEKRTHGSYVPSAGVVYPTLAYLEEAGLATSTVGDGNRRSYAATDAGRAHLAEHKGRVDELFDGIERFGRKMERARVWFDWVGQRAGEAGSSFRGQPEHIEPLENARRRLRAGLRALAGAPEDEQRRAAEILERAADEIERKAGGTDI